MYTYMYMHIHMYICMTTYANLHTYYPRMGGYNDHTHNTCYYDYDDNYAHEYT